ncbi:hypothetical protein X943_003253 [Babesia divergens]|uniref:Uncharacterized protein n=1 Tax=Babesia divergens TaxID=32595 RepID=A0AAD9G7R2_BABDI|nr:hypothetical protein X943_003253 [Babesia divergens]
MTTVVGMYFGALCLLQLLLSSGMVRANNPIAFDVESLVAPTNYITLDISDLEFDWRYHYVVLPFGEGFQVLVVAMGPYHFERVMHGDTKVYSCDVEVGCHIQFVSVIENAEHRLISVRANGENLRFAMMDGSVVRLTPKEYNYTLKLMASSETLDINQRETTDQVETTVTTSNGRTVVDFDAFGDYKIDKIVDGETVIWEYKEHGEFCTALQVSFIGDYRLVEFIEEGKTYTEDHYYAGKDGRYVPISDSDFFICRLLGENFIEEVMDDSTSEE